MSSPVSRHVNMSSRSETRGSSSSSVREYETALKQKDETIASMASRIEALEKQVIQTGSKMANKNATIEAGHAAALTGESVVKRVHPLTSTQHIISDKGRKEDELTRGSTATANVLRSLAIASSSKESEQRSEARMLAQKFLDAFNDPSSHAEYLTSHAFAAELLEVCDYANTLFEPEPRNVFLQSPVYVFGDIHGNLEDLHFFADNVWKLGMDLTAGSFLFLGDYVDRGKSGLECIAYLLALKVLYPHKLFMLRGNHEVRDVNGWEEHYGDKSFLHQCKYRFGNRVGESVWEKCNQVFDRLPLSAVIDHDIFCIHGGIPRQITRRQNEISSIMEVSSVASVMPPAPHESEDMQQICLDCLWSDPAPEEMEPALDYSGFGESPRGGGAICFGNKAIDNFLKRNDLSYIIRAHEAHAHGVSLSKSARVFTVFSTSKDHRQGGRAMAGCVLVDNENIKVINRSHKYKNKYVHRRSSISLQGLSEDAMENHRKLGLVRYSMAEPDANISSDEDENTSSTAHNTASNAKMTAAQHKQYLHEQNAEKQGSGSSHDHGNSPDKKNSIFQSFVPTWLSETI